MPAPPIKTVPERACGGRFAASAPFLVGGLLYVTQALIGLSWGLPSRDVDRFLFSGKTPPTGVELLTAAGAAWGQKSVGADVDLNPLEADGPVLTPLNDTEAKRAAIAIRYRLYTYQPDEMIVMRAIGSMRPESWGFDPKLYQYGGLFLYPVAALLKAGSMAGLIDLRADVAHYLDHPEAFGRFYLVSRGYAAAWGLIGLGVVVSLARRLHSNAAAWVAAVFYPFMPVIICMSHEGKPHLPGAVLMLLACRLAIGVGDRATRERAAGSRNGEGDRSAAQRRRSSRALFLWMSAACGAAIGMVLSSGPILILVPMAAAMLAIDTSRWSSRAWEFAKWCVPEVEDARKTLRRWLCSVRKMEAGGVPIAASAGAKRVDAGLAQSLPGGKPPAAPGLESVGTTPHAAVKWVLLCSLGVTVAAFVYVATNPYVLINRLLHPEVLESNFSNSLAMYEIGRFDEGLARVLALTIEGAGGTIALLGFAGILGSLFRLTRARCGLIVPGALFFLQFVLIGAGKPAEYGRFGVFFDVILLIFFTDVFVTLFCSKPIWRNRPPSVLRSCQRRNPAVRRSEPRLTLGQLVPGSASIAAVVFFLISMISLPHGAAYLRNFHLDSVGRGTRMKLAQLASEDRSRLWRSRGKDRVLIVAQEPAPYSMPPLDLSRMVILYVKPDSSRLVEVLADPKEEMEYVPATLLRPIDSLDAPRWNWDVRGDWPPSSRDALHTSLSDGFPRRSDRFWWWPTTPISWANKPFEMRYFYLRPAALEEEGME